MYNKERAAYNQSFLDNTLENEKDAEERIKSYFATVLYESISQNTIFKDSSNSYTNKAEANSVFSKNVSLTKDHTQVHAISKEMAASINDADSQIPDKENDYMRKVQKIYQEETKTISLIP